MNVGLDVYRPPCPRCGHLMQPLFTTARCYRESCRPLGGGLSRPSRVVGHIPDDWVGASARMRQLEGRPVRMVLNPDEVPVKTCWFTWFAIQYCSAVDFDFSSRLVRNDIESMIRNHCNWSHGPPSSSRNAALGILAANRVLLIVD